MEDRKNGSPEEPLILISNDDGIDSEGIAALAGAMGDFGEVYVVAPMDEQSAVGHAITVRDPVRARAWDFAEEAGAAAAWAVSGTPADCVKLAVNQLLPRRPALVASGVNRGPNTAVNVLYSGTVSAATEGAILGIDAAAFSLCEWDGGHYATAARVARRVARRVLEKGLPEGVLLNVNVPSAPMAELAGTRVTRQARALWKESFTARVDPFDEPYYWMAGEFVDLDEGTGTDLGAVEEGYVSVTPIQHDLTAYDHLAGLREWTWGEE
ncbi:MAG: 5'/3'-nucleotidase SurE [Bacteroidetes bacterium QS_9_68_14]|nr:MAG: 5'/3'-nucleotidase SurE [Bacteroidetes bacterium QS_9_68_14]